MAGRALLDSLRIDGICVNGRVGSALPYQVLPAGRLGSFRRSPRERSLDEFRTI